MQRLRHFYVRHQPADEENTRAARAATSQRHYDLSNELFALFLDESMTYSSRVVRAGRHARSARRRARSTGSSTPPASVLGTRVLEIGTGWGALAVRAARRGAHGHHAHALARAAGRSPAQRAADAGVGDRVDVQLRDYRDVEGPYDAVVSVEMIEAVGERVLADLLRHPRPPARARRPRRAAGDRAASTTGCSRRATSTRGSASTSSPVARSRRCARSSDASREHTGLRVTRPVPLRRRLRARRCAAGASGSTRTPTRSTRSGFDAPFRRMWDFYLAYCEAGFATGYLDVAQLVLSNRGADMSRDAPVAETLAGIVRGASATTCPCGSGRGTAARSGRPAAPVVVLRNRRALRRLLWSPGELGLARGLRDRRPRRRGRPRRRLPPVWAFARDQWRRPLQRRRP